MSTFTADAWFWRALVTSALVATCCSVLGVFLYLRRMSLIADALAHVALPGIVVAFLLTGSAEGPVMLAGATVVAVGSTWLIEALSRRREVRTDAAIGVVFTSLFSLGVIGLTTFVRDAHIDLDCVLFGNVLGVSDTTLTMLAVLTPVVLTLVFVFWRWLSISSFDPTAAFGVGVPVVAMHYGLLTCVAVTSIASFEAVGAVLGIALIIVPAATAHLLADRLVAMVGWAIAHGLVSAFGGLLLAVQIDCSAAGAMVVVGGALYAFALVFAPRHGWVARTHAARRARGSQSPVTQPAGG